MNATDWIALFSGISVVLVAIWQVRVGIQNSSDEREKDKKDADHAKWKSDMEGRMSAAEKANTKLELDAKDLISRNELSSLTKEIFDEIKGIRIEVKADLTSFQANILAAIGHRGE